VFMDLAPGRRDAACRTGRISRLRPRTAYAARRRGSRRPTGRAATVCDNPAPAA